MSFKKFNFDPKIAAGIKDCGYQAPTPIQDQNSLPLPDLIDQSAQPVLGFG